MKLFLRIAILSVLVTGPAAAAHLKLEPFKFETGGKSVDAERGELSVPENRSKGGSRQLTLRFVRFPSTSAKPGSPIVYLAGGPGNSGIDAARGSRFGLFMAMREFGDVIAFDQRGTGGSDPRTTCSEEFQIATDAPLDRKKGGEVMAAATKKCVDRLNATIDIAALNTRESAADLDDLRRALGAKKLTLWGISYGTHLGVATARYYPQSVDRLILAGIEGPDDTYKLPSDQELLLHEIARLAHKDGKAPDLIASIGALMRELEARPKSVTLVHPVTKEAGSVMVGKFDLQRAIANMLGGPENFSGLPGFVARLEAGDWTTLALDAAGGRFGTAPSLMMTVMDCASGQSEARRQQVRLEASRTLLGDAVNFPFPEICAAVPFIDAGETFRAPLHSDIPALLISGTLDGRTRPRQAEELRQTMPNAQHLVIEGAGHSDPLFLSSPKILEAMIAFMLGEKVKARSLDAAAFSFMPLRTVITLSDETLSRYAGTYEIGGRAMHVIKAGSVLYFNPAGGPMLAVRPFSQTEFFGAWMASPFVFELDEKGNSVAFTFESSGTKLRAERQH